MGPPGAARGPDPGGIRPSIRLLRSCLAFAPGVRKVFSTPNQVAGRLFRKSCVRSALTSWTHPQPLAETARTRAPKGRAVSAALIMKPRMAKEDVSDRTAGESGGSIGLVVPVAVVLVAAAVGLMFVGRNQAEPYVLALLAILGMIGVFSLFAAAAGILRVARRDSGSPILKAVVDGAGDGIVVTDPSGRVIYANAAYLKLADAVGTDDVRPVERVFLGDPEVSEAIYRLVKAAREGRSLQEEVRVAGLRGEAARWLRRRVRPLGEGGREARTTVWAVADVTRARARHETDFQGLQYAIDYLDHAPAGFFSVDESGHIGYLNATLAGWLDHDLAQIGSGGLRLTDHLPGGRAAPPNHPSRAA